MCVDGFRQNSTFKIQKERIYGSVTQFQNVGTPKYGNCIFRIEVFRFLFERIKLTILIWCRNIQDGGFHRKEHNLTLRGRSRRHVSQFRYFGTLITLERIEVSASNFYRDRGQNCQRIDHKLTPKWASCSGSRNPILKFWDPL